MSWSITSSACYSALISSLLTQQKLHYSFIVKEFRRRYTRNCYGRDFKATDSILHINIDHTLQLDSKESAEANESTT